MSSADRILVAMSGGVDSSVAAALLARAGHDVVGVWMRLHDVADTVSPFRRSCCSLDAAEDARRVAGQLGIPFYILDLEREFGLGVIEPFLASYAAGRTPSPCIDCNTTVKFGALLGRARHRFDAAAVATGHYARTEMRADGSFRLLRAADEAKDQTYFLYGLGQDELRHSRFPLGDLTKPEVRAVARDLGLVTADKAESQGICFVPGGDVRGLLAERTDRPSVPGPIMDADGDQIGEHPGAVGFTIGQRAGLGVALGTPRYVARLDTAANLVVLARRSDLETRTLRLEDVRFVADEPPARAADGFRAEVRIRHRGDLVPATVRSAGGSEWTVDLDRPAWAAAPGQAAVLYDGQACLGGGRIAAGGHAGRT